MGSQVTEPGRREQGIADRVRCDIPVRMAGQSLLARPEQPGEIQRPAVAERVDVRSHAYLREHAWHNDPGTRGPQPEPHSSHRDATCT